jgi:tRNA dimethylallyltransferase
VLNTDRAFICLFGPTAVGKTSVLETLFAPPVHPRFRGHSFEVVSGDSVQVYRGLDIGSAKPSPDLRALLPHHLVDIRSPDEQYHAGDFVSDAETCITAIRDRARVPLVSGGTPYYFRNLLYGLPEAPAADRALQQALYERAQAEGLAPLRAELERVDPATAGRIAPADLYRTVRALEVYHASGRPLSDYHRPQEPREDLQALLIGLDRDRAELYSRINERVDQMFDSGLVAEVDRLRAEGYSPQAPGLRAIGYREFFQSTDETEIRRLIKRNSRRYAKRQLTFFRSFRNVRWFHPDDSEAISEAVETFLGEHFVDTA